MALYVSTTGTLGTVVIETLGALELVHPVTDLDLELSYPRDELYGNSELQEKADLGYITIAKATGGTSPVDVENVSSAENNEFVSSTTETLTADLTLDVNTQAFQYIDPGASNRTITLPTASNAAGRIIYVMNVTSNPQRKLFVTDGSSTVTIRRRETSFFHTDGTNWYAIKLN